MNGLHFSSHHPALASESNVKEFFNLQNFNLSQHIAAFPPLPFANKEASEASMWKQEGGRERKENAFTITRAEKKTPVRCESGSGKTKKKRKINVSEK